MSLVFESAKVVYKSVLRFPLLYRLRNLVDWQPLQNQSCGYTIVIAAMHQLWQVAAANLQLIAKCEGQNLREVLVVMDESEDKLPQGLKKLVDSLCRSGLAVRLIGYNSKQLYTTRAIEWGWVYSWLSWSIGIRECHTRWVILHDLDAMPIDPNLFEKMFTSVVREEPHFQGTSWYAGNGISEELQLVKTFEMFFDAQWLRQNAKPIEGFNQIRLVNGGYVDFDTWLFVQRRAPKRRIEPINEDAVVHPSQLICQFTDHIAGRTSRLGSRNRLPVLAYFMKLGDSTADLTEAAETIASITRSEAILFGRSSDIGMITPQGWAVMEKQIRRLEQNLFGRTRDEIEYYLRGFILRAGRHRTVGQEPVELGGVLEM